MLGQAAVAMWWDVAQEVRAEWEEWHTVEHMPERLGIPGFVRGTRCTAISGEPSYFVLYEADQLATLTGGAYVERLNHPTPWSRRMMPHHRNMARSLCSAHAAYGEGVPGVMATVRFSPAAGAPLPLLPKARGVTGVDLLQSQALPAQTEEQKIRGKDAAVDWVMLIGGYDADAVHAAAENANLPGALIGMYRVAFSLASA